MYGINLGILFNYNLISLVANIIKGNAFLRSSILKLAVKVQGSSYIKSLSA
jgi:hypothetical protein